MPQSAEPDTVSDAAWTYDDPGLEREYQAVRRQLLDPPPFQHKALLLIGTLLLFVLASTHQGSGSEVSLRNIVIIVAVLVVHELGHYAGMRAFGYRDVRMFFIPFFGAAVSGTRGGVARWKQALVLLLGPLPGIGLGLGLLLGAAESPLIKLIAVMLLVVNGLNLLPVAPLDGGQFFQVLLFSRQRYLELGFIAVAAIVLGYAGFHLGDFVLGLLGLILLRGLPYRWRVLRVAHELRAEEPDLPADPAALDNLQSRMLFTKACEVMSPKLRNKPRQQAIVMDDLLDRATQQPPSLWASLALLAAWGCGIVALLAAAVVLYVTGPTQWQPYTSSVASFRVDFPGTIVENADEAAEGHVMATHVRRAYVVAWFALPGGADTRTLLLRRRDDLLRPDAGGVTRVLVREDPPGENDLRLAYRLASGPLHQARIVVGAGRIFTLVAAAADEDADSKRFLDSFRVVDGDSAPP